MTQTVNIDTIPGLFYEVGEKADTSDPRALCKALAGRCALFAGIVQKMAKHIEELEGKLDALTAPLEAIAKAMPRPVGETPEPKAPEGETPEEEVHGLNPEAMADLEAEAIAAANKMNNGPTEVQMSAVQEGALFKGEHA